MASTALQPLPNEILLQIFEMSDLHTQCTLRHVKRCLSHVFTTTYPYPPLHPDRITLLQSKWKPLEIYRIDRSTFSLEVDFKKEFNYWTEIPDDFLWRKYRTGLKYPVVQIVKCVYADETMYLYSTDPFVDNLHLADTYVIDSKARLRQVQRNSIEKTNHVDHVANVDYVEYVCQLCVLILTLTLVILFNFY